jgi:hypothetical protein
MPKTAKELIAEIENEEAAKLKLALLQEKAKVRAYRDSIEKISKDWKNEYVRIIKPVKPNRTYYKIRIVIADVHGCHMDKRAVNALLNDLVQIGHLVTSVILIGDILDCGGLFSRFQKMSTYEFADSYKRDVVAANGFLNDIQKLTPRAKWDYLFGNHEWHVERFAAQTFPTQEDAEFYLEHMGPAAVLDLDRRGIKYYKTFDFYDGLGVQSTIKRGKCYFTHGYSTAKHAAYQHLIKTGNNVVYGDTHRAQSHSDSNVDHPHICAWCPGCLCEKQPLYAHMRGPSGWSHGYGLQFYSDDGEFIHWNVPIVKGKSMVPNVISALKSGNIGRSKAK